MCYVVMKKDISEDIRLKKSIEKNKYFDLETPYGYGGPLVDGTFPVNSQQAFINQLLEYCKSKNIVSQFIRFHPLLNNHKEFNEITDNKYLHDTIFMDTSSVDLIFSNMDSKNRNMIRKAKKAGVQVIRRPMDDYKVFFLKCIVKQCGSMMRTITITFNKKYFAFISSSLKDNAVIFYAILDNKPIWRRYFPVQHKKQCTIIWPVCIANTETLRPGIFCCMRRRFGPVKME